MKMWGGESRVVTLFFVNFVSASKTIEKIAIRQNGSMWGQIFVFCILHIVC